MKNVIFSLGLTMVSLAQAVTVETHTASDAGFAVNSHLIAGRRDAILIDAQFTRDEATKVVGMVRASGKRLTTVFVTHAHPDHYFGLEIVRKAFPAAKIVATASVVREIRETGPGKLAYWKPIYKDAITDTLVVPEPLAGNALVLEGARLPVVELGPGESESAAVVHVPELATLVSGDLAFHGVHLWLAENRSDSWLKNLADVTKLGKIDRVLTGHGGVGGVEILTENREYIEEFDRITSSSKTAKEAYDRLVARFPRYRLPIIADISVKARLK